MLSRLLEKGIRVSLDAEELAKQNESLLDELVLLNKPMIGRADIELLLKKKADGPKMEVKRESDFKPLAKEYESNVKAMHTRDVTGKSRGKGEVADFVSYFRSRYEKTSKFLLRSSGKYGTVPLSEIKRHVNGKARVVVSVSNKSETKKGNVLLEVEDLTSEFKVVIPKSSYNDKEKVFDKAKMVLLDDVIAISGKVLEHFIIAEDIEWPDMPIRTEKKLTENDLAIVYISDLHFGSRYFLDNYFNMFIDWLHGKEDARDLASKVKYIVVAGDIVDGIGIYPNQERELVVRDIYKQYQMFDDFLERVPDHIEVIVAPGNHDAVRRGEPMPAIPSDLIKSDRIIRVGNPSVLSIEGLKHIIYHGTSMDSLIAAIPGASYNAPEKVMVEYLKRRHLSPIYGGNLIIPEKVDYFVIEDEPDVLHCGHVHKNGSMNYRGTLVINSGTFQDRTDYQAKQGHMPTPAMVSVYETKTGKLHTIDFKS